MRLKDKIAFITGGGRGIGRAIALGFAQEGAHVTAAARTQAEVEIDWFGPDGDAPNEQTL